MQIIVVSLFTVWLILWVHDIKETQFHVNFVASNNVGPKIAISVKILVVLDCEYVKEGKRI